MNVWYLSKYVSRPGLGYVGMRAYYLMEELSKRNCNVDLITSNSSPFLKGNGQSETDIISDSFHFHQLSGYRYSQVNALGRVLSWVQFEIKVLLFDKRNLRKPDVIVVSSLSLLTIISGFILSRRYRAKLVFEVRDIWPLTLTEEGGFSRFNPLIVVLGWLERWGYLVSDLIIGTMPNLTQHVAEVAKSDNRNVICIPMGVPDDLNNPYFGRTNVKLQRQNDIFEIGYVGTIGKTNALDVLFEALEKIDLVSEGIRVTLVGGGPLLEKYRTEHRHISNLVFLGHKDKEKVPTILDGFDAVFFSTFNSKVWDYGQSLNKVIDYMLSGKPIICCYSGYRSMVNEADCGWFVPAQDSDALASTIVSVAKLDADLLSEMGHRGASWIRQNRRYSVLASALRKNLAGTLEPND